MTAATRDDVAALAGVSPATVSYVLNNGPKGVSADKRDRVLAACRRLGYRPNAIARGLRSRRTRILGLVIPDTANPYFSGLARSLEDAAFAHGYHVVVGNSADDPAREAAHLAVLFELRVEGILFVAADVRQDGTPLTLAPDVPVVMVDRELPGLPFDAVVPDNAMGGRIAAQHLIALGHRRFGCVGGPAPHRHAQERLAGLVSALVEAGLPEPSVREGRFDYASGFACAQRLLDVPPDERPSALVCANDAMAIGALRAASELRLRVPDDVSVIGFDDVPQAAYTIPPLTTVAQSREMMAHMALDMLIGRLSGKQTEAHRHVVPVQLVVRSSTGPIVRD